MLEPAAPHVLLDFLHQTFTKQDPSSQFNLFDVGIALAWRGEELHDVKGVNTTDKTKESSPPIYGLSATSGFDRSK